MKKYLLIISCIVLTVQAISNKYISYSYYDTAPLTFMSSLMSVCANSTNQEYSSAMKVSTFFTSSYNSESLAAYFSPFNKKELVVKEDVTANGNPFIDRGGQDILSYNFNLVTQNGTYESILQFEPSKKVWMCQWDVAIPLKNEWSLQITIPLVHMKTTMGLQEKIKNDGGGADNDLTDFNIGGNYQMATMKDAFANKQMKYGKIDGEQKLTRPSDITIKLYKEYGYTHFIGVRPFLGVVLPTSNKPTAEYMFEPIVGNGHHAGLVSGLEFEKYIGAYSSFDLSFESIFNLTYLFSNHQMRSIDPAGKPWGRYLAMFASNADRVALRYSFGINECTTRVKVDPGMRVTYNAALIAYCEKSVIKVGYQATIHAGGYITLPQNWSEPAIASIVQPEAQTNPARGINNLLDAFKDTSYYGIHSYEMSTTTAVHPFYMAHQFMVSAGVEKERNTMKFNIDVGATLSYGTTNAVPTEWSLFLTCNCSV